MATSMRIPPSTLSTHAARCPRGGRHVADGVHELARGGCGGGATTTAIGSASSGCDCTHDNCCEASSLSRRGEGRGRKRGGQARTTQRCEPIQRGPARRALQHPARSSHTPTLPLLLPFAAATVRRNHAFLAVWQSADRLGLWHLATWKRAPTQTWPCPTSRPGRLAQQRKARPIWSRLARSETTLKN